MPSVSLEVLLILLLILTNGVFAMSELAVVSARKVRLHGWARQGNARAQAALELAEAPNRFLSTIQISITLVGILAGALGGVTVAERLAAVLEEVPLLQAYARPVAVVLVVLGITYLTLILGELVPKRLALTNPERIATLVAGPMRGLARLASPVVWLLSHSTEAVLWVLRVRPSEEPPVTGEEIRLLAEQGTRAGVFQAVELGMLEGVLRMGQRRVSALMTPRPEVVWLDLEAPPEEQRRLLIESGYTRLPVGRGSLDQVEGMLHTKDLLSALLSTRGAPQELDLSANLREPLYVPESMPVLQVLETFRQTRTHQALVVDEYGTIQGLITPNHLLESIVGELPAAGAEAEPEVVRREDGSWLVDGMLPADELRSAFGLGELPGEERGQYQTLGGFVMSRLGRIPREADRFEWGGLEFEVVDMDGHRVDKVLIHPRPPEGAEEG